MGNNNCCGVRSSPNNPLRDRWVARFDKVDSTEDSIIDPVQQNPTPVTAVRPISKSDSTPTSMNTDVNEKSIDYVSSPVFRVADGEFVALSKDGLWCGVDVKEGIISEIQVFPKGEITDELRGMADKMHWCSMGRGTIITNHQYDRRKISMGPSDDITITESNGWVTTPVKNGINHNHHECYIARDVTLTNPVVLRDFIIM